jgi:hypothetical protein
MVITIQTVSRSMSVLLQLGRDFKMIDLIEGATQLNDLDNGDDLAAFLRACAIELQHRKPEQLGAGLVCRIGKELQREFFRC